MYNNSIIYIIYIALFTGFRVKKGTYLTPVIFTEIGPNNIHSPPLPSPNCSQIPPPPPPLTCPLPIHLTPSPLPLASSLYYFWSPKHPHWNICYIPPRGDFRSNTLPRGTYITIFTHCNWSSPARSSLTHNQMSQNYQPWTSP